MCVRWCPGDSEKTEGECFWRIFHQDGKRNEVGRRMKGRGCCAASPRDHVDGDEGDDESGDKEEDSGAADQARGDACLEGPGADSYL